MSKIIGLSGFIGSGKGAVAKHLVEEYGYVHINFSDALKDVVSIVFNWPRDLLEGDTPESREWRETRDVYWSNRLDREITPRIVLQLVGTESFRNIIHPEIWVANVEKKILDNPWNDVVISDVRFVNEVDMIKSNNGHVFRVERGVLPDWYFTAKSDHKNKTNTMSELYPHVHVSEYSLVGVEVTDIIKNNGTLDDLFNNVNEVMKNVF